MNMNQLMINSVIHYQEFAKECQDNVNKYQDNVSKWNQLFVQNLDHFKSICSLVHKSITWPITAR